LQKGEKGKYAACQAHKVAVGKGGRRFWYGPSDCVMGGDSRDSARTMGGEKGGDNTVCPGKRIVLLLFSWRNFKGLARPWGKEKEKKSLFLSDKGRGKGGPFHTLPSAGGPKGGEPPFHQGKIRERRKGEFSVKRKERGKRKNTEDYSLSDDFRVKPGRGGTKQKQKKQEE